MTVEESLARMKHKHGRLIDGRRHYWDVEKLWALSKDLPVRRIKLESIRELDQDCWFADSGSRPVPTIRNVAFHCARIIGANMAYPVLLCAEGRLIDGGHRIARALIEEKSEIDAVYMTLPPADAIL
ncbi:hypothetical protein SAMN02799624_04680 [Paenibacillus sp. UNC496MF]|uniref:chromosome partitioning protein ParB n=1 Tax=Paenibacillus sp. UNC496MF TaxID=1502753 RepID=UPI0008EF1942|nr:chromosome partitioning protein ParB [Paenibacillus sp. UNC496MF]SFJ48582.1 hypothetical protein SAMN02799624_04680 [Paenibacillus sp. UNC496MF]